MSDALAPDNGHFFVIALSYRAEVVARRRDRAAVDDLMIAATRAARAAAGHAAAITGDLSEDTPGQRAYLAVVEASWRYCSIACDDLESCFSVMGDMILGIHREWPDSLTACPSMLDTLAVQLPVAAAAGGVWRAINALRRA